MAGKPLKDWDTDFNTIILHRDIREGERCTNDNCAGTRSVKRTLTRLTGRRVVKAVLWAQTLYFKFADEECWYRVIGDEAVRHYAHDFDADSPLMSGIDMKFKAPSKKTRLGARPERSKLGSRAKFDEPDSMKRAAKRRKDPRWARRSGSQIAVARKKS